jgi:hypothetical protein
MSTERAPSRLPQGFDGFLSSKETRRSRAPKVASKDEYLFSLSSATSDVWLCLQQTEAQDADFSQGATGKRVRTRSYPAM